MASGSKKDPKKFFDIAKPGKTMPSSSSRPAIVGHRTLLKDPMMAEDAPGDGSSAADEKSPVSTTVPKLQPLTEAEKETVKPSDPPEAITPDEPGADDKKEEDEKTTVDAVDEDKPVAEDKVDKLTAPKSKDIDEKTEARPEEVQPSDSPDDVSEESKEADSESPAAKNEADKQAEKASLEAAAKLEATEKTIADKTYFLPIGERKKRRSAKRSGAALFLIIILLLALGYLAVDSGMVKTSWKPPVRLFKAE